jgi:hypothetical protein
VVPLSQTLRAGHIERDVHAPVIQNDLAWFRGPIAGRRRGSRRELGQHERHNGLKRVRRGQQRTIESAAAPHNQGRLGVATAREMHERLGQVAAKPAQLGQQGFLRFWFRFH